MRNVTWTASLAFGATLVAVGSMAFDYPWWLTVMFQPHESVVADIPVETIDKKWAAASLLRDLPMPPLASDAGKSVADHGGSFDVQADLDGDGRNERAVVGVYATQSGFYGRFLLLLATDKKGKTKHRVFVQPGEPGFSVMYLEKNRLFWAICMECEGRCEVLARYKSGPKCESCCVEEM